MAGIWVREGATEAEAATTGQSSDNIFQLKVTLANSKPPIWRRLLVAAHTTLADLHPILQALMGWYNAHLHQYEAPGSGETSLKTNRSRRTSRRFFPTLDPAGEPLDWFDLDNGDEDEAKAFLDEVAPAVKSRLLYIYDMGDDWEHDIVVEKILPRDAEGVYPVCIAGKRNGPIEDTGGIWGYENLLEVLADPDYEDHKQMATWLKDVYGVKTWDGDAFDLEGINKKLARLRPRPKRAPRGRKAASPE